jgi:hypothetical protein
MRIIEKPPELERTAEKLSQLGRCAGGGVPKWDEMGHPPGSLDEVWKLLSGKMLRKGIEEKSGSC